MACNILWRYAQFANNTGVMSAVEPLCHETAQRILDLRVPASGIYSEMDEEGNISERMHPEHRGLDFPHLRLALSGPTVCLQSAGIPRGSKRSERELRKLFDVLEGP